ncbi:hypothetical protein DOK67_0001165 [Enterococcus sp. DIV0212c]
MKKLTKRQEETVRGGKWCFVNNILGIKICF